MANRAFLLSLNSPFELQDDPPDESSIACGASYMIPLGWLALFTQSDIKNRRRESEDDESVVYEVLSCLKSEALARAAERWQIVESVIRSRHDVFQKLCSYLSGLPGDYVAVETFELWATSLEGEFRAELDQWLGAFLRPSYQTTGWLFKKHSIAPEWKSLLSQANATENSALPLSVSVAGYGWLRDVPWQDDP